MQRFPLSYWTLLKPSRIFSSVLPVFITLITVCTFLFPASFALIHFFGVQAVFLISAVFVGKRTIARHKPALKAAYAPSEVASKAIDGREKELLDAIARYEVSQALKSRSVQSPES